MGKILRVYGYSSTVLGGGMLSLGLVANESALYVAGAGFVLTLPGHWLPDFPARIQQPC